ncbi:MAG: ABC transporter substrate-binding protein [Candidatus Methanomethylicaceae archaeon]
MKSKSIFAIAIAGIMVVSVFAFVQPLVLSADQPLFKMTLVAPGSANLLRRQWGLIIANSFQSVGIDARVVFLGWGSVYDRILTPPPENIGKTWDEGGWDALFIGWTPGAPSTPFSGAFQIYYSKNLPPNSNYFLWNNPQSDRLIEAFMTKGYTPEGIQAFKDWQMVQYNDVPASQIFFSQAVFTADSALNFHGYEWIFDNIGPTPQFLTGRSEVVLATTGELLDLCPPLSNSWYDTEVFNSVFDSLYYLDPNYEFKPAIALDHPTVSADGRTFTYKIRPGVYFHDGIEVTADDVVFSFLAYLNPQSGSQQSAYEAGYIGEDITFKWLDGSTTRLVIDLENGVGYYPAPDDVSNPRKATIEAVDKYTVRITIADFGELGKPAATFHPEGDGVAILPKHVLGNVPFEQWKEHPFNKGTGTYVSNGQTFSGPIGCGPYKFVSYDPVRAIVTLEKYNNYWNKANLEAQGLFQVQKFYVRYIVEKDAAIAALKNGEVHILDQNYQLSRDYQAGNLNFATNYILRGSGIQQLGYNMRHPVFGTGTATPLGKQDPSRAAEAARYVRLAFEYLIPRKLIIENLLSGFAEPASVHVNPLSPYYNTACVPRDYNPEKAKEYLAMAGYKVPAAGGQVTVGASYLVNEPIVFTGQFIVDPVIAVQEGGFVALLEMSTDNSTFTPVAQTITTTGGYYQLVYVPTSTGTYYFRVSLPGVGAKTAAASTATGPTFPYSGLTLAIQPEKTEAVKVTVTSIDEMLTPYKNQVSQLNSQVASLNSQVASLTNLAYGAIVLAIIAIIIAAILGMRKK